MRIIDIPEFRDRKAVLKFEPDTPLLDACKKMAEHNYGSAVITVKGKLVGIFTERDLLVKVAGKGLDMHKLKLKDVMTPDPKTANMEDSVIDSLRRMNSGRFRHLPIVDDQFRVTGIVSQGDFVAVTWGQIFHRVSQQTRSSFQQNTTIWMVLVGVLIYTLVVIWAIKTL
jgi:CBS domain-containing protein